jgi:ferredoxin
MKTDSGQSPESRATARSGDPARPVLARSARTAILILQILVLLPFSYIFVTNAFDADAIRSIAASSQIFPGLARIIRTTFETVMFGASAAAIFGAAVTGFALPLVLLSALFGRWYCAFLCPLGTLQAIAASVSAKTRHYRKNKSLVRIAAALFVLALSLFGAMAAASWLDPWSLFGRFVSYDIRPFLQLVSRADAHGFGISTALPIAAVIAAILVLSAASKSRWFCSVLCPVGSLLGALNCIAPFKFRIDASSCISCGSCEMRCPAACIDLHGKRIDESRCVFCASCAASCPTGAVYYGRRRRDKKVITDAAKSDGTAPNSSASSEGMSRAAFLSILGGCASALVLAALPGRRAAAQIPPRSGVTVPPGAESVERFIETCTACGLCISACPSSVLQPSLGELGPRGLYAPALDFSVSYCQYECTSCMNVCPSGALKKMPLERKKLVKIGTASLVEEYCIVFTNRTKCGACAEHCPTGAVRMVARQDGIPEPVFDPAICIGCGACHHVCPVPGKRAISVAGLAVHGTALEPAVDFSNNATAAEANKDALSGATVRKDEFPF